MRRYLLYIALMLISLTACTEDYSLDIPSVGDKEVWAHFSFGHRNFDTIDVKTRATLSESAESRVENLYVYIFDAQGNRLYSHFYDYNSRVEQLPTTAGNYWTVNNRTSSNQNDTNGEVMIKSPTMSGGSIYLIANLNADQLNISADQLNTVRSLSELQALTITMNQEITSRTGIMLMAGNADNVTINEEGEITQNGSSVNISLVRLDAKVTVNVQVGEATTEGQEMKGFIPESWQIMKLPKGTYLLPMNDANGKLKDADQLGYFDSPELYFESNADGVSGFSFYILENMEDTSGLTSYAERDSRSKNDDGSYNTSNGLWEHASEDATYIVIKGKVQMTVDSNKETGMQYLEADVTYYLHLGDFGSSKSGGSYNDFTIRRNTHYNYTITIRGVSSIETEVTTKVEEQPAAMGNVYKSKEEIYTFDAHYGQRVFRINAESVLDENVTWYVKTPFSEGTPSFESGTQIPNLDYKWVWFMVNGTEYNGVYSARNRKYPGDQNRKLNIGDEGKLMNVVEFTEFIQDEKIKWKNAADDERATASAFKKDNNGVYCIYLTVFVDEYYYEADPLNSENRPKDLWKKFVNQPNRLMHILCDSKVSDDGDSSLTSSVITIRQRSIQTPYNIEKGDLISAWGCESEDEFADSHLYFYNNEETMGSAAGGSLTNIGTASDKNGLYNTARLWGLVSANNNYQDVRWDTYLEYERPNDYTATIGGDNIKTYFLKDNYVTLRYSTLLRNRDNNGNGVIDPEEVKWYVASIYQLYDLYMGELGLNGDAVLYPPSFATRANYTSGPYAGAAGWRNHIISSSWNGSQPIVLWAEEGISVSNYADRYSKPAPYSIRCVRNLGLDSPSITAEGEAGVGYPTELITVTESNGVYKFDLSNINDRSVRYFTSHELETGNEKMETAKVYYGFETGNIITFPTSNVNGANNSGNYLALKEALEAGNVISPTGYRVPNVREGALMSLYCSQDWWNNSGSIMVGTWYSNGDLGNSKDAGYISWTFSHRYATIGSNNINRIRTVRDWDPSNK
ncbi:MAG: DUF4906 domain-containing protein [Alistipes sp.]|nr:DUF4906 domain-containing protein [Alistipes sp.]